MKLMWESLRHNRAEEFKTHADDDDSFKENSLPEGAERTTHAARPRPVRYKPGRLPERKLRVDRLKGLHLLLAALESPRSTTSSPCASVLRRSGSVGFLPGNSENSTGTLYVEGNTLLRALDSHQLGTNQEYVLTDGTTAVDSVTPPDSSKVFDSYPAILSICKLPIQGLRVGGLRKGSRMAGGKKGKRLKAQENSNAAEAQNRVEPTVQRAMSSNSSHVDDESKSVAADGERDKTSGAENCHASEESMEKVDAPASRDMSNGRHSQRPTCSLSEPDLATMEYTSGWLGDGPALRIASLLSGDLRDEINKADEDVAGLLADGTVPLINEVGEKRETLQFGSERVTLLRTRSHTLARHLSRKGTSSNLMLQLEGVAGDYGEAYEEMERRITVCNVVGRSVLKGIVRAITEEAAESESLKHKDLIDLSQVLKGQDAKIAQLQEGLQSKESELATMIKEFQFHENKYVTDLLREKEAVVQKSREKENCLAKKENELTELAQNMVKISLLLDAESKKATMLEKQMKDLRDAQALKVREIASLIEETEKMKDEKESALEAVKREARVRELRVKEELESVVAKKEEEIEGYRKGKLSYRDKVKTLESVEENLRLELSSRSKQIVELDRSKNESMGLIDSQGKEIEQLKSQNEKLTALLEDLVRQMGSREATVQELQDQARAASQESSIILDLWNGKMGDVIQVFKAVGDEQEHDRNNWHDKFLDQGKALDEKSQQLEGAMHANSELKQRVHMLEAEKEDLQRRVTDLTRDLEGKSSDLNEKLRHLSELRGSKSTMEHETESLKMEIVFLTEQLNKQRLQRETEAQENAINVQELERLQEINGNMVKELRQMQSDVALHKSNFDEQSVKLDETRRCWADDKSNHSLILEDNRKELVSLRNLRGTLEEQIRTTNSENDSLKQVLEDQQKQWDDEENRLKKDLAAHQELLDEKIMELLSLRGEYDKLEKKLRKAEQEVVDSAAFVRRLSATLEERTAALGKLETDFHTFVENFKEVHQKAFEHELHLESSSNDMWSQQWRLEMELDILVVYFGSTVEEIVVQADAFANRYSLVAEQLASCLNELEQKNRLLEEHGAQIEDVQASNRKLKEISDHLCGEIEGCNEEIFRCKLAVEEATSRAGKAKSDFVTLQEKMADVRSSLEEKLSAQVSEILQLKSRLEDADLQEREKDWICEAESSLILHAVDVWRDHMKEEVAAYVQELSSKDHELAQLRLQLEDLQQLAGGGLSMQNDSCDEDAQKNQSDGAALEWALEVEADILTVVFEDKVHELAVLLNASRRGALDTVELKESNGFALHGEGQTAESSLKALKTGKVDRINPTTSSLDWEAHGASSEGEVTSKIEALEDKVNQALVHMDSKLDQLGAEIQEQAWVRSLEVGIVAHLLGEREDDNSIALDGNCCSKQADASLNCSEQEIRVLPQSATHAENHRTSSGDDVRCTMSADAGSRGGFELEEGELLNLVRKEHGQSSMSGLDNEARLKIETDALVTYIKAKMYAWSREKDTVIAEKTEQLYALKRKLLNEREEERVDIIRSKEREIEAIRKELERKEQEEVLSLEQRKSEHDRILARLKEDWDAEKARLLELVREKGREKEESLSKFAEEHQAIRLDFEKTIAEMDSKILVLSEELAASKTSQDSTQARVDELILELAKLKSEMDEQALIHLDEKKQFLGALDERESSLRTARDGYHLERSTSAALEAKLNELEESSGNSLRTRDVALAKVTSELQEERKQREKLESDLRTSEREVSLLTRESALQRKQVSSDLGEHVNSWGKLCETLECNVAEKFKQQNSRLDGTQKQLKLLQGEVRSLQGKNDECGKKIQKLLRNLHTAEEEVDLLGDDVDALSDLLEQVDEKLSQFQPVLVHYPGMMELVKLVRDSVIQRMESKEAA